MGLSRAAISWLLEESHRRPFRGTLLTLGVQNVFLSQDEFEDLSGKMGVELAATPSDCSAPLIEGTVSADHVFRRLGFDRVATTDADEFEGCDFIFDLNDPEVPTEHREAYDMVLDAGTLEHVFHLPNALANLQSFTAVGGRIVHQSPSSNHIDHGFWMFSPTLFWDYYTANGLNLPRFDLFRYRSPADRDAPWVFGTYSPHSLDKKMFGGLGGGCFGVALVAEKTAAFTSPVIPQQGLYADAWSQNAPPGLNTERPAASALSQRRPFRSLVQAVQRLLPEEWKIRRRAFRLRFPLTIRKRY